MKILTELSRACEYLSKYPEQWAICGGVAASIYRVNPRFTNDIDFALIDTPSISAMELASRLIKDLGFQEYKGFIPDSNDPSKQTLGLICARGQGDERFVGLDFLLPTQFWVKKAVILAQSNLIDFGFAKLPTITPESLIFAKLIALSGSPERYQDMDDIKEILMSIKIDKEYLMTLIEDSKIELPTSVAGLISSVQG